MNRTEVTLVIGIALFSFIFYQFGRMAGVKSVYDKFEEFKKKMESGDE